MSKPIRFSETVVLEMSLKPFKRTDNAYIEGVCETFFTQYRPILKHAKTIGVMLWSADGSQILEYKGDLGARFHWAEFIGGAQFCEAYNPKIDPDKLGLHSRNYPYTDKPPVMTYGILKQIVFAVKSVGARLYPDKEIIVGETFDPGPEFAVSPFKYERHREILGGESMGKASMVFCYADLHADDVSYAAFPNGIKEGTPFAAFLGAQANAYLSDLGFDFLWLSNGMGFGMETWRTEGAIFDGERFDAQKLAMVKDKILAFWTQLRAACPDFPILVRGTNLICGVDYATDGTPLDAIYDGGFVAVAPPNSPWAALDGDFGLELAGYMSRIAHLPAAGYMFRYYIHDPWWMNSPWYDRYEGQPHDIYLPMSIGRIDENGKVEIPNYFNILSIDNCMGDMPDSCVNEPLPHILKAYKDAPDAPPPLVWVYPFDEYMAGADEGSLQNMFAQDWFIRDAINEGFPLSGVVSTANFIKTVSMGIYAKSVLVSAVPQAGSAFEAAISDYVSKGGRVIFYGSVTRASEKFKAMVGVRNGESAYGEFEVDLPQIDSFTDGNAPALLCHRPIVCADGIDTFATGDAAVLANAQQDGVQRAIMTCGEHFVWLRGTTSCTYEKYKKMPERDAASRYLLGETLLRRALEHFGTHISFVKPHADVKSPVLMPASCDNGLFFSVYTPNTTVGVRMRFPLGAPLLLGYEAELQNGCSVYHFPRAVHAECRVFVEQTDGIVSCREVPPVSYQMRRRIGVYGLKDATVRFFAETECMDKAVAVLNSRADWYFVGDRLEWRIVTDAHGTYLEATHVTGDLVLSMPRSKSMHKAE